MPRLLKWGWWLSHVDHWLRVGYILIMLAAALALTALILNSRHQNHKISNQAHLLLTQGNQIVLQAKEIQQERKSTIFRNCKDQNRRHDNTIKALNLESKVFEKTGTAAQLAQLKQSKKFTILLINALVPKQNCYLEVKLATSIKG